MIVVAQANVAVGHKPSAAGPVSFFSLLLKFQVDDISNDFKHRRIFSEDYHFEKKAREHRSALGRARGAGRCRFIMKCPNMPGGAILMIDISNVCPHNNINNISPSSKDNSCLLFFSQSLVNEVVLANKRFWLTVVQVHRQIMFESCPSFLHYCSIVS